MTIDALDLILQPNPDAAALVDRREQLAAVRSELAEHEADVVQLRARLKVFESRYIGQVGVLYAELDEAEARIAEREAVLYDSDAARRRAEESRQRARETRDAAFGAAEEPEAIEPPPSLKTLFREVAKRIHPDFARDPAEQDFFTLLMARANEAYRRGDQEALQRLLDDHREIHSGVAGESVAAELLRIARQMQHAKRDIAALEMERQNLLTSEIGLLHEDAETAATNHRDLLAELAAKLRERIAEAQRRFDLLDRQIGVHGR